MTRPISYLITAIGIAFFIASFKEAKSECVTVPHTGVTMEEFCRYQTLMVQLGGKWVHNGCPLHVRPERKP
jgi:hypothetical protein